MRRIFKNPVPINWKYLLTELLLIVVGILLAINLNGWSANRKLQQQTTLSIERIADEVKDNITELEDVMEDNKSLFDFLRQIVNLSTEDLTKIDASAEEMDTLRAQHDEFFLVLDSTKVEEGQYQYQLEFYFELEYAELSDIAWETAKISNVVNEFPYDCLKAIISIYSFQELYDGVQGKFLDSAIFREEEDFAATFILNYQLAGDLVERYQSFETEIADCQ